ncbi:hypothetical protein ACFX13_034759 [Malus domestica]
MDTLDQISTLAMAPRKIYFHLDLAISQKILAMVDEGVTIPSPHQGVNNRMLEEFTQTTASTTTASPKSDEGRHNTRVNLPAPPVSATFSKTRLTEDSIFSLWTLETVDGICVAIKGFINEQNTIENGIPSEEIAACKIKQAEHEDWREFSSAPISKRFDIFTLDSGDCGWHLAIKGFINQQNSIENRIPSEVVLDIC